VDDLVVVDVGKHALDFIDDKHIVDTPRDDDDTTDNVAAVRIRLKWGS
jgi:hypothetical protein